ncbi:hypothetical protein J6Y73_04865 [bacterium]|nr:hypothetical protein [bacterium]
MSKKQSLDLSLICLCAAFLFSGVVLIAMVGAAGFSKAGNAKIVWGSVYDALSNGSGVVVTAFIFVILALAGSLALVLFKLLNFKFKFGHLCAAGLGALALTAGILFFFTASKYNVNLGVGAIFSGIFAILSAFAFCGYTFLSFKK